MRPSRPERSALLMLRADSAISCIKLQVAAWRWMRSTPYVLTALLHADKSWSFNPPAWYEKEMVSAVEQSFDHHGVSCGTIFRPSLPF